MTKRLDVELAEQLIQLQRVAAYRTELAAAEAAAVSKLRERVVPWRDIADALQLPVSVVHNRHARRCQQEQLTRSQLVASERWRAAGGGRRSRLPAQRGADPCRAS